MPQRFSVPKRQSNYPLARQETEDRKRKQETENSKTGTGNGNRKRKQEKPKACRCREEKRRKGDVTFYAFYAFTAFYAFSDPPVYTPPLYTPPCTPLRVHAGAITMLIADRLTVHMGGLER